MTANEKAVELVEKYKLLINTGKTNKDLLLAKICASVAVDTAVFGIKKARFPKECKQSSIDTWEEVRKEIKNLQ